MTQLQPSRCKLAEFERAVFSITPEEGTPFDALLDPGYWAHVSGHFRIGSRIEIYPPEGNYYAELFVQACGRLFARVAVLRKIDFDAVDVSEDDLTAGYTVKYSGMHAKWAVYRVSDKTMVASKMEDKPAAMAWLAQHVKTVGKAKAA